VREFARMKPVRTRRLLCCLGRACRWAGAAGFVASVALWLFTFCGWCGVSIDDGFWSNSYQLAGGAVFRAHNNAPQPRKDGLHGFHLSKRVSFWWEAGGRMVSRPLGQRIADFKWWPQHVEYFLHSPGSSFYTPEPFAWVPLWMPLAASAGMWMLGRRLSTRLYPQGGCQCCGYDRAGLAPAAACPECGSALA
jgi:hypothetical protein